MALGANSDELLLRAHAEAAGQVLIIPERSMAAGEEGREALLQKTLTGTAVVVRGGEDRWRGWGGGAGVREGGTAAEDPHRYSSGCWPGGGGRIGGGGRVKALTGIGSAW